jgi:formylmethanofuran dehydrogenase subunit C
VSTLTFTLRQPPAQMLDLSPLTPDQLAGKPREEIARIELTCGNRKLRVADLFDVSGEDLAQNVVFRASTDRLARVGARMRAGTVTVEGDCGPYAGLGMRAGRIAVHGNAGAFTGSGMRAGQIEVRGNAGAYLGGARPGDMQGMRGGSIVIGGCAGDRVGDRMRRGIILVRGDAGAFCGSRMLAGTILVSGRVGESPGFGLKHGTVLLTHAPAELPTTFQDSGEHALLFLKLLEKYFQREGGPFNGFLPLATRVRRYCGDLATGGKGEILLGVPESSSS